VRADSRVAGILLPVASLGAGLAVLAIFFTLSGYDPAAALGAMFRGAFGSWYAFSSGTLVRAVSTHADRTRLHSRASGRGAQHRGEGQFYLGAIAATWIGLKLGSWPGVIALPVMLAVAFVAGAAWVAVPAWLRLRFGVLEVISTLLLNFVGRDAGELHGAGTAAGVPAHLSPERPAADGSAAAGPSRHPAAPRHRAGTELPACWPGTSSAAR
jgi:simple sugar transport system permease protein